MNKPITKIEVQKKNKNRVNVYLEEEYGFACSAELVYRYGLKIGKEIDLHNFEEILEEDDYIKGKSEGLKVLEKNYKTEQKVIEKLYEKGYAQKTVDRILSFLKEYEFLKDEEYAESFVQSKIKGAGRRKIQSNMMERGFSKELIEEKINEIDRDEEKEGAVRVAEKKYEALIKREEDPRKVYKKLGEFLFRKGYSTECVKSVLRKVIKNEMEE